MDRIITEDVEEPIEYCEKVSSDSGDNHFKIEVIFSEYLTKPKTSKINGFNI